MTVLCGQTDGKADELVIREEVRRSLRSGILNLTSPWLDLLFDGRPKFFYMMVLQLLSGTVRNSKLGDAIFVH